MPDEASAEETLILSECAMTNGGAEAAPATGAPAENGNGANSSTLPEDAYDDEEKLTVAYRRTLKFYKGSFTSVYIYLSWCALFVFHTFQRDRGYTSKLVACLLISYFRKTTYQMFKHCTY